VNGAITAAAIKLSSVSLLRIREMLYLEMIWKKLKLAE
jgi:hypothetical protein